MAYYESIKRILELRLIGRSSLSAISELLKRQGLKYTSTGFISETLHKIGESLGNLIVWEGRCVWASDELFFKGHQPILVTVDVASHAILSISKLTSLTKESWTAHFERQLEKAKTQQLGRETRFWGLKTPNLQQKIYDEWLEAEKEAEKEVLRIRQLLEGFNFLYRCILAQFTLFDTRSRLLPSPYLRPSIRCALILPPLSKMSILSLDLF